MKINCFKVAILILSSVLLPSVAHAATPSIMLEKSASYALSDTVRAFTVPTIDSTGKVKYFDVIIDLNVNAAGIISPTANVLATPFTPVATRVLIPGKYQVSGSADTCDVSNLTLTNGRIQSIFKCTHGATVSGLSVVNGTISAGHPFLAELLARKVNLQSDVATQTWGLTDGSNLYIGSCLYYGGYGIGAKTNGSQIILSTYSTGVAPHTYRCGNTLTKLP